LLFSSQVSRNIHKAPNILFSSVFTQENMAQWVVVQKIQGSSLPGYILILITGTLRKISKILGKL
jgi:hypothetical protein